MSRQCIFCDFPKVVFWLLILFGTHSLNHGFYSECDINFSLKIFCHFGKILNYRYYSGMLTYAWWGKSQSTITWEILFVTCQIDSNIFYIAKNNTYLFSGKQDRVPRNLRRLTWFCLKEDKSVSLFLTIKSVLILVDSKVGVLNKSRVVPLLLHSTLSLTCLNGF